MTNKRTIVKHLKLLYGETVEDIIDNTIVIYMDNCGSFKYWLKDACNKTYWEKFIELRLVHPDRDIPLPSRDSNTHSLSIFTNPNPSPTKEQISQTCPPLLPLNKMIKLSFDP